MITNLAQTIFEVHQQELERRIVAALKELDVEQAARDLAEWEASSQRKPAYNPQELALARLVRKISNHYEQEQAQALLEADAQHQALITLDLIQSGLAQKMITEGQAGRKLGLLELTARLMPCLNFNGSSSYFEVGIVPYGKNARTVLGEKVENSYVSETAAENSARNLAQQFQVHYALAETSAAPRTEVPKSGKKPEVYICGLNGLEEKKLHAIIDTPLRTEFNAHVRELMYLALRRIYHETRPS